MRANIFHVFIGCVISVVENADQNNEESPVDDASESENTDGEVNNDQEIEQEDGSDSGDNDEMDSDNDADEEMDDDGENAGWAAALAKTLEQDKPKNKKYLVLSRAKKLAERELAAKKPKADFEIEDNGEIKPEIDLLDVKPTDDQLSIVLSERKERHDRLAQLRVKPSVMDHERERSLKRIATKGVVQLFNAVRSQQRDLVDRLDKAGPLDHKRDEVLNNINKRQFLDMLMGGKRAKSENVDNPVKNEDEIEQNDSKRPSQWSVLSDDFMTNKKLASHWDNDGDDSDNE